MVRTLGISPKVIMPIIGHLIVGVALLFSGHQDLAWEYASASVPVTGILGYLAHAGIVIRRGSHGQVVSEIDPQVLADAVNDEIQRRITTAQSKVTHLSPVADAVPTDVNG